MSAQLHRDYKSLRTELDRLGSGIAALVCALKHEDVCIAIDLAHVLESHACAVLDAHPEHEIDAAGAEGGAA